MQSIIQLIVPNRQGTRLGPFELTEWIPGVWHQACRLVVKMLEVTLVVTGHLRVGAEMIAVLQDAGVEAEIIFDGSTLGASRDDNLAHKSNTHINLQLGASVDVIGPMS